MGAAPQEGRESHLTCSGAHGCVMPTGHPGRKAPGSQAAGLGQAGEETGGGEAGAGYRGEVTTQGHTGQVPCRAGDPEPWAAAVSLRLSGGHNPQAMCLWNKREQQRGSQAKSRLSYHRSGLRGSAAGLLCLQWTAFSTARRWGWAAVPVSPCSSWGERPAGPQPTLVQPQLHPHTRQPRQPPSLLRASDAQ